MALSTNQQQVSPALRIGQLRRRVTICKPSPAQDSDGGTPITSVIPVMDVWASVDALSATDKFASHEFVEQCSHKIVLRYQDGIDSSMLVKDGSDLFIIKSVQDPDRRKRMLLLMCVLINDGKNTMMGV